MLFLSARVLPRSHDHCASPARCGQWRTAPSLVGAYASQPPEIPPVRWRFPLALSVRLALCLQLILRRTIPGVLYVSKLARMSEIPLTAQPDVRRRLVQALGFKGDPSRSSVKPYLSYIFNHYNGQDDMLDDWLELFIQVVQHFDRPMSNPHTLSAPQNAGNTNGPSSPDSIRELIREVAADPVRDLRPSEAEDEVMYILGIWSMMEHSSHERNRSRAIISAYTIFAAPTNTPYDTNLKGLLAGSGLLPGGARDRRLETERDSVGRLAALFSQASASLGQGLGQGINLQSLGTLQASVGESLWNFHAQKPIPNLVTTGNAQIASPSLADIDAIESQSIAATRLNAFTLRALSAVEVRWTYNISRHMLLATSNDRFVLELFGLPCAFPALQQPAGGLTNDLTEEIQGSYAMPFNAWYKTPLHLQLGSISALSSWCWCWSCSARRYRGKCLLAAHEPAGSRKLKRVFCKPTQQRKGLPIYCSRI